MSATMTDFRIEEAAPGVVVAVFEGDHDVATSREIRQILGALVEDYRVVVADLSAAGFIDSAILHALTETLAAARAHGHDFRLQLATAYGVRMALECSGLLAAIPWYETREEAVSEVRRVDLAE